MRVLLANKFFYPHGGSEEVLFQERSFLTRIGAVVIDFSMSDSRNVESPYSQSFVNSRTYGAASDITARLSAAAALIHSREAVRKITALIRSSKPDVVHCHNIYHQLSPSIIRAAKQLGVPVVLTLHDFKVVCPTYIRMRNGRPCSACVRGQFSNVLRYRCAEGSVSRSALLYFEAVVQRWLRSYEMADHFIAPSQFMMDSATQWRFLRDRVSVVYNGIACRPLPSPTLDDGYFLYLGRLTSEKGLLTLAKAAASTSLRVVLAGAGPLEGVLRQRFPQLELIGHQKGSALQQLIGRCAAVVTPSEWYENCPMSVLEAMACGKPVIASRIGGIPELVRDGETGVLFEPGNFAELRAAMLALAADSERRHTLGRAARVRAQAQFSLERHNEQVLGILRTVSQKRGR
jgi:glycosyltransferase involved in cell wall biosynthesis